MNQEIQALKDDLAFMRALTGDGGDALALNGALLVVIGVVFGLVDLQYWLHDAGIVAVPAAWEPWLWLVGVAVLVVALPLVRRRYPASPSAASRGMLAAWTGVGIGSTVAAVALAVGGWRLGIPSLVTSVFPIVLFTLYGVAWWVAFAVKRRAWFALVAVGCFAVAIGCGALIGTAEEWLVLALGLFLLGAVPGLAIIRRAHAE